MPDGRRRHPRGRRLAGPTAQQSDVEGQSTACCARLAEIQNRLLCGVTVERPECRSGSGRPRDRADHGDRADHAGPGRPRRTMTDAGPCRPRRTMPTTQDHTRLHWATRRTDTHVASYSRWDAVQLPSAVALPRDRRAPGPPHGLVPFGDDGRCAPVLLPAVVEVPSVAVATVSRSGLTTAPIEASVPPGLRSAYRRTRSAMRQVSIDRRRAGGDALRGHDTRMPGGDSRRGQPLSDSLE